MRRRRQLWARHPARRRALPLQSAAGAGALTVVHDVPPITVVYQDPKEAVKSIAAFVNEKRPAEEPATDLGAQLARQVSELT
jgi:hypothetical protein